MRSIVAIVRERYLKVAGHNNESLGVGETEPTRNQLKNPNPIIKG